MKIISIIIAIIFTALYLKRITHNQYRLATSAGFYASITHFAVFLSFGCTPIRAILYASFCFVAMVFGWIGLDIFRQMKKRTEYNMPRPLSTYFFGGMIAFLSFSNLFVYA